MRPISAKFGLRSNSPRATARAPLRRRDIGHREQRDGTEHFPGNEAHDDLSASLPDCDIGPTVNERVNAHAGIALIENPGIFRQDEYARLGNVTNAAGERSGRVQRGRIGEQFARLRSS